MITIRFNNYFAILSYHNYSFLYLVETLLFLKPMTLYLVNSHSFVNFTSQSDFHRVVIYNQGSGTGLISSYITEGIVKQNTEVSIFIHNLFHQDISAIAMKSVRSAVKSHKIVMVPTLTDTYKKNLKRYTFRHAVFRKFNKGYLIHH